MPTTWLYAGEVFPLKLPSPEYIAVKEWLPSARVEVERVARPEPFNVPVPKVTDPSLKVIVPVGVPPETATTAVMVTAWLIREGLGEEKTVTEVADLLTVWVRETEVLLLKLPSPA